VSKSTSLIFAIGLLPLAFVGAHADADLSHPQEAIHAFNQGVERFNAKDCNGAIDFFSDAISRDADFAEAYYARGACRYSLQGTDGAIMDLSDAIRLKPELLDARALRGVVYYEGDHWDNALGDFNYVLERSPTEAQSLLGRGVIHLRREEVPAAEKDFRAFLKAHPDHPYAPKLRKILSSLKGGTADEAPAASNPSAAAPASSDAHATAHRSSARAQALADALLRQHHDFSDQYTRQVLRGERGQAVGDISTHTGQSDSSTQNGTGGVDIVEPQK
jgi:tetratricopeptide (TPR) repeat protein